MHTLKRKLESGGKENGTQSSRGRFIVERKEREREKDRGEGRLLRLEYLPVSSVTSRIMQGMMERGVKGTRGDERSSTNVHARGNGPWASLISPGVGES